jgi:hypothetical protein
MGEIARVSVGVDREGRRRRIEEMLRAGGFKSLSQASRAVDLDYTTMHRIVSRGLPPNPRLNTVRALQRLGIYELVGQRPPPSS